MTLTGDKKRDYQRKWMAARRDEWIKENGPCANCGSWENLTVDHKDYKTKKMNVAVVWSMAKSNPKRIAELAKCQVLCETCHKEKTTIDQRENKTKPLKHGTQYAYNAKGCRCDPCKLWRAYHYADDGT